MMIRPANDADIPSIARINVDSWRSTYRGIIPDAFLDGLSYEKRAENFRRSFSQPGTFWFVAELPQDGIVGFITGGPERTGDANFTGELYAVYVRDDHCRRGIGAALIRQWAACLRNANLNSALVWVLAENKPAITFYERLGARLVREQTIQIGGAALKELAYGWQDLSLIGPDYSIGGIKPPSTKDVMTTTCEHVDQCEVGRICHHLLKQKDVDYFRRFTGIGVKYDLVCSACAREPESIKEQLASVCSKCFAAVETDGCWEGIVGTPEIRVGSRNLTFHHVEFSLPELAGLDILDVQPVENLKGQWVACCSTGLLIAIDTIQRSTRVVARLGQDALDFDGQTISESTNTWVKGPRVMLCVSRDGSTAAVANTYGDRGIVVDFATGRVNMQLRRDKGHEDVSAFPLAFCEPDNRLVIIHGTQWNRLDVSDPLTGVTLTLREPTSRKQGQPCPPHYLDYFHCQLSVSPAGEYIADNGWAWQPVGVIVTWNLRRWLSENVWESEDGETKKGLCQRSYYWDGPLCWMDDHHLIVWGYGDDDECLIPAIRLFDVRTGEQARWFPGPKGSLVFDKYLFSFAKKEGMSVWDIETGERLAAKRLSAPLLITKGRSNSYRSSTVACFV